MLDNETLQKTKIFGELSVAARVTSSLKKLLADCFKTVADGPKTGLLAARAIFNASVYKMMLKEGPTVRICFDPSSERRVSLSAAMSML